MQVFVQITIDSRITQRYLDYYFRTNNNNKHIRELSEDLKKIWTKILHK